MVKCYDVINLLSMDSIYLHYNVFPIVDDIRTSNIGSKPTLVGIMAFKCLSLLLSK